jgi:hypothetical protein
MYIRGYHTYVISEAATKAHQQRVAVFRRGASCQRKVHARGAAAAFAVAAAEEIFRHRQEDMEGTLVIG